MLHEIQQLKRYTLKTEEKLERVYKEMKKYREQLREQEKEMALMMSTSNTLRTQKQALEGICDKTKGYIRKLEEKLVDQAKIVGYVNRQSSGNRVMQNDDFAAQQMKRS